MAATHVEDHETHHEAHESRDKQYVLIALFLAALTVVEVLTYATPQLFGGKASVTLIIALMALMAIKFWTVAWFFMHLKFDKRLLTVAFYAGVGLALAVYIAILSIFRFWGPPASHVVPITEH